MNSDITGPGFHAVGVVSLFVSMTISVLPAAAGDALFADDAIFELTIRAPLSSLTRQSDDLTDVAGSLELDDGTTITMTCNKYGISRLRECHLASLKITVEEKDVLGTPFEGRRTLRLVTPCRLGGSFDRHTVLEYLVYKSYAEITEPALRVRLARVHFLDSEKPARSKTGHAFFIEDIGRAAARNDRVWLDIEQQEYEDLDAAQFTLMALFQYMVGNTDWSAVRGPPGGRCCHNVAVFGGKGIDHNEALPFDFDQAGLVDSPYAVPDESLGIRRVTERVYRGRCEDNEHLPAAVAVFNAQRSELEALFGRDDLPYADARKKALKYIDGFYATINDPRKLDKKVKRSCR